jgi:hypothetical protein
MCDTDNPRPTGRRAFLKMMTEDLLPASELAAQTQRDAISATNCVHSGICPFQRMKTTQDVSASETSTSEPSQNR